MVHIVHTTLYLLKYEKTIQRGKVTHLRCRESDVQAGPSHNELLMVPGKDQEFTVWLNERLHIRKRHQELY